MRASDRSIRFVDRVERISSTVRPNRKQASAFASRIRPWPSVMTIASSVLSNTERKRLSSLLEFAVWSDLRATDTARYDLFERTFGSANDGLARLPSQNDPRCAL